MREEGERRERERGGRGGREERKRRGEEEKRREEGKSKRREERRKEKLYLLATYAASHLFYHLLLTERKQPCITLYAQ